jgi:hypothetical protein
MSLSQCAACARCDKEDCSAVVIIPCVPEKMKQFKPGKQSLEMVCPACHRFFSVELRRIEYRDVTDEQLTLGFMDRHFINSRSVH